MRHTRRPDRPDAWRAAARSAPAGRSAPVGSDAVRLEAVSKVHGRGGHAVTALRNVTVGIGSGSFTAVMGPSGSGKSTLLQCAAGLDQPTSGRVLLGGTELAGMSEDQLASLRRQRVGFVFQAFNLVPSLTVEQNITLPLRLAGRRVDRAWLRELLGWVGLADRARHRPAELSGGQQQRVAIARALVPRPDVLFADEPTGALDLRTAQEILGLLRSSVDGIGQTVVMVTHDPAAASCADTVLFLADGQLVETMDHPDAGRVADRLSQIETRAKTRPGARTEPRNDARNAGRAGMWTGTRAGTGR